MSRVNSDLINLLDSVQIAIVMVTNDLRIRRFTPMAERVLNLMRGDVGRPISDIKPNIDCENLETQISEAIDTISIRQSECRDRNGKRYSLRIRPYKNLENRIDGAVIALFEVQQGRSEPLAANTVDVIREPVERDPSGRKVMQLFEERLRVCGAGFLVPPVPAPAVFSTTSHSAGGGTGGYQKALRHKLLTSCELEIRSVE